MDNADESVIIEEIVGQLLTEHGSTIATAESCTGGMISQRLTNISGSSRYFPGGIIAYSNAVKVRELNVSETLLATHGAVSAEVACAMASGVRERFHSDYGLSVTGIAGPTGGTKEKPVGLAYMALAGANGCDYEKHLLDGNRAMIRFHCSQLALDMLRRHLLAQPDGSA